VSARQLRFLLVPPHAEYDAADQESLAQIAKAQLVVQSPEHHERDDVARLLSPIQPAATALVTRGTEPLGILASRAFQRSVTPVDPHVRHRISRPRPVRMPDTLPAAVADSKNTVWP
jgi:hypothetical protein